MTKNRDQKNAARSLATLTGLPYQKCQQAADVLRAMPAAIALGDLAAIIDTRHILKPSVMSVPNIDDLHALFEPPIGPLTDDREIIIVAGPDPVMLAQLDGTRWGVPNGSGATIWHEVHPGDGALRPFGTWRTTALRLRSALTGAGDTDDDAPILVEPLDTDDPFAAPFLKGLPGRAAYINDKLASITPSQRESGADFDWVHISFTDLDMTHEPGAEDHRLSGCDSDGTCGLLHHWPTSDVTHTRMTLPAPLLAAFQELFDHEEGLFSTEDAYMCEYTDDGAYWYGLDLPHVTSVWMRVQDDGMEPTS